MGEHPLAVNLVVTFFTAAVFAALMTAFWWFVASEELVAAVRRKASVLAVARDKMSQEPLLRDAVAVLDVKVRDLERAAAATSMQDEAYRRWQNRHLTGMWMAPAIAAYTGLLLGAVAYNQTRRHVAGDARHRLSFGHWGAMVLILCAYIPELLFFLFVIEWRVPIGDYEMGKRYCGFD